jgi:hypothetical protein
MKARSIRPSCKRQYALWFLTLTTVVIIVLGTWQNDLFNLFCDDVHLYICTYSHSYSQISIVFLKKKYISYCIMFDIFPYTFQNHSLKSKIFFMYVFVRLFFVRGNHSYILLDRTSSSTITWNNRLMFVLINLSFPTVKTHTCRYSFFVLIFYSYLSIYFFFLLFLSHLWPYLLNKIIITTNTNIIFSRYRNKWRSSVDSLSSFSYNSCFRIMSKLFI